MTSATLQRKLQTAVSRHKSGDVDAALQLYAEVLQASPDNADAWHLSGLAAYHHGDDKQAESLVRHALELSPGNNRFKSNLASILVRQEQYEEAESLCREVLKTEPSNASTLSHFGAALQKTGRYVEALEAFKKAVGIAPDAARYCNLGAVLADFGRGPESAEALEKSYQLDPSNPQTVMNLGIAYRLCSKRALALRWLDRAELLLPESSTLQVHKTNVYLEDGQLQKALETSRKAVALDNSSPAAVSVLGRILQQMGHWEESLEIHSLATLLEPDQQRYHSSYLYAVILSPLLSEDEVVKRHAKWGNQLEASRPVLPFRPSSRSSNGVLRVGYVSPDFRDHATMRFLMPLLQAHDRSCVELYCYSELGRDDATTASVKQLSDGWHSTCGLSDDIVAKRIQDDQIDILVDLAGHTGGNRLAVFALKPAPVQVSFLGYPGTTGLSRIDYFLTDAIRTPPSAISAFTETPVMMPGGACCYEPASEASVAAPALQKNGYLTLGSTHRVEKISPQTWRVWADVMSALPDARLLLFRDVFKSESLRSHTQQIASEVGIDTDRIQFGWEFSEEFLDLYADIDILLDVFPWGSGTTAYDCMWMGVPIPSILGDRSGCRATASLLTHCGFPELIASNSAEYVRIVASLANDPERLTALRKAIRPAMQATVCDGEKFARDVEAAYRTMWENRTAPQDQAGRASA